MSANLTNITSNARLKLHVKESLLSLSQDDFAVTNMETNDEPFRIRRQLISFVRQTKILYDKQGNVIWKCKHPLFKMFHRRYRFYGADGNLLFIIRSHFRLRGQGKKLDITLADGSKVQSKGNPFDRETNIVHLTNQGNDMQLGHVSKPLVSVRGVITGLSGYTLVVEPGADIPMCLGFVVVLDEEREREPGGGLFMLSRLRNMGGSA